MDDLVASLGKRHEPVLKVGDLNGMWLSVLHVGVRVDWPFRRGPHQACQIQSCSAWYRLEEFPEEVRSAIALVRAAKRLKRSLQKHHTFWKLDRLRVSPRFRKPTDRGPEVVRLDVYSRGTVKLSSLAAFSPLAATAKSLILSL